MRRSHGLNRSPGGPLSSLDLINAAADYIRHHQGDARRALWHARRRDLMPEAIPARAITETPAVWFHAATCDQEGIHVLDSGGTVHLVGWTEVLPLFMGES